MISTIYRENWLKPQMQTCIWQQTKHTSRSNWGKLWVTVTSIYHRYQQHASQKKVFITTSSLAYCLATYPQTDTHTHKLMGSNQQKKSRKSGRSELGGRQSHVGKFSTELSRVHAGRRRRRLGNNSRRCPRMSVCYQQVCVCVCVCVSGFKCARKYVCLWGRVKEGLVLSSDTDRQAGCIAFPPAAADAFKYGARVGNCRIVWGFPLDSRNCCLSPALAG